MKKIIYIFITFAILSSSFGLLSKSVFADTFNQNNIMDDAVFDDYNSMTASQIQSFLGAFPKSCLTNYQAPYPTDYWTYGGNVPASTVIKRAADLWQINPKVILTTLEKEENLVSGNAGCDSWRYNSAVGMGCPDGGACPAPGYEGFSKQVTKGMWQLMFSKERSYGNLAWGDNGGSRYYGFMTAGYRSRQTGQPLVYYDGYATIDNTSVYMSNGATAALYTYTPHFHGNQNFQIIFNQWFGSTHAYVHNGVSYSAVFDAKYYMEKYPDIMSAYNGDTGAAFAHFVSYGMKEGRQGNANFDVTSYRNRYQDLRVSFGTNLPAYYLHYIYFGRSEGRIATGDVTINYITDYGGIDCSAVYGYTTYISKYPDLKTAFGNDDAGAIAHFVNTGMNEGRQASDSFNVISYKNRYPDLRIAFGNNLKAYYIHYIMFGKNEGRIATGDVFNGISTQNGIDYSAVYNFNTYIANYSDIKAYFGNDDTAALAHFVTFGMNEGRQASDSFNVQIYKSNYADLRTAFGNNLKAYYLHYINFGKKEGRIAI